MKEPTLAQQLRASVKLVKPELLATVPDDYDARQTFNYLRHRATNYDELLKQHRAKYGDITPAENKALTQGAADVIVSAFRAENADLLSGQTSTAIAKLTRSIAKFLGITPGADLQAIRKATRSLKASQSKYKSWNDCYRRQRDLVLEVIKSADPEVCNKVKEIYKSYSKPKLDALEKELFGD